MTDCAVWGCHVKSLAPKVNMHVTQDFSHILHVIFCNVFAVCSLVEMWFVLYRLGIKSFPFIHLVHTHWRSLCNQEKPVGENKASWQDLLLSAVLIFFKKKNCFFVVIDKHESVIIISLKVNHFFCDVEKV